MRALVAPIGASLLAHLVLVLVAQRAPASSERRRKSTVPLVVREPKRLPKRPEPPPPPPEPRRIARLTPRRVAQSTARSRPTAAPPPPPAGFSVDTKNTVESSPVAVAAKAGGGNPFADPASGLPPGDKATAPQPPPPAPFQPAQWITDERDRSPPYPAAALRHEIEGQVLLRACIGSSGEVQSVQVIRGLGFGCDEAAADWAKQRWHFRPARRGDKPVPTCILQPMRFQLRQ